MNVTQKGRTITTLWTRLTQNVHSLAVQNSLPHEFPNCQTGAFRAQTSDAGPEKVRSGSAVVSNQGYRSTKTRYLSRSLSITLRNAGVDGGSFRQQFPVFNLCSQTHFRGGRRLPFGVVFCSKEMMVKREGDADDVQFDSVRWTPKV